MFGELSPKIKNVGSNINFPNFTANTVIMADGNKNWISALGLTFNQISGITCPGLTVLSSNPTLANNHSVAFYTGNLGTFHGQVGPISTSGDTDIGMFSTGGGNFLRFGTNNALIGFWMDNNIANNNNPNVAFSAAGSLQLNLTTGGIEIAHAAVSGSTANSTLVTGVVLSLGASGTINNSSITTSHQGLAFATSSSGTATTQYQVTCGSGTFSVSGGSLDNSTVSVFFIKSL